MSPSTCDGPPCALGAEAMLSSLPAFGMTSPHVSQPSNNQVQAARGRAGVGGRSACLRSSKRLHYCSVRPLLSTDIFSVCLQYTLRLSCLPAYAMTSHMCCIGHDCRTGASLWRKSRRRRALDVPPRKHSTSLSQSTLSLPLPKAWASCTGARALLPKRRGATAHGARALLPHSSYRSVCHCDHVAQVLTFCA